jgi:hypothetical protein
MTIENAIQKAIEGGYDFKGRIRGENWDIYNGPYEDDLTGKPCLMVVFGPERRTYSLAVLWIDPLFWQCLGKALGWGDESECPLACCGGICPINIPMWQSQWHRFISHLSGGGTIGSFFENIEE